MASKPTRTVSTAEFEAQCLELIDEVAETGEDVIVTEKGRRRVRIVREPGPLLSDEERMTLRRELANSVTYHGDIVSPLYPDYEPRRDRSHRGTRTRHRR